MPRRPKQGRVSKAARSSLIIKSSLHITRSTSPAPLRRSARFRPQTVTNKQANDNDSKDLSPTGPTFPFLKLPRELQFKIWDMVGAKPRIIMQTHEQDYRPLVTIVKPCHTPVQLHVHQASRLHYLYREDDAANAYKDHPMYRGQFRSTSKKLVFFSFEIDTLLLNDFKVPEVDVCENLRHLAVDTFYHRKWLPTHVRSLFPSLQTLTIIFGAQPSFFIWLGGGREEQKQNVLKLYAGFSKTNPPEVKTREVDEFVADPLGD